MRAEVVKSEISRAPRSLFPLLIALSAPWWPLPSQGESAPVAQAPEPGGGSSPARKAGDLGGAEEEGDRFRGRAEPAYRRSREAWEMAQRFAERFADPAGVRRALEARAGLSVLLLDARSLDGLRETGVNPAGQIAAIPSSPPPPALAGGSTPPGAGLPAASPAREAAEETGLAALAQLLRDAGRAYFGLKEKEPRDLPLLFESLALAERLLADLYQAQADLAYRRALAAAAEAEVRAGAAAAPAARPSVPEGARARAARLRLSYKLRDFEAAGSLAAAGTGEELLSGAERLAELRIRRDLARFRGERAEALAFDERLLKMGDKAEEVPLPAAALPSFLAGKTADLHRAAETLRGVVEVRRLPARELLLARYLEGLALLESGEPAAAAEALDAARAALAASPARGAAEGDGWLTGSILARLGEARSRSGDLEGADLAYRRALRALEAVPGTDRFRARVAMDQASTLVGLGRIEEGRQAALALLAAKSTPGDLRPRLRILLAAILYLAPRSSAANLKDALATLALAERERALGRLSEAASEELRALILVHTGNVRHRLLAERRAGEAGRQPPDRSLLEEAIRPTREALAIARAGALPRLEAACQANLAELLVESGDLASGRREAGSALTLARREHAFETEWRAHWYLARAALAEGDAASGEREMEEAAGIVEEHRARILEADHKVGFMAEKVGLYEAMLEEALSRGDGERAFRTAERARARGFLESLGLRYLLLGADRDRQVYREYINLLSRLEEKGRGGGELFGMRAAGSFEELREKLNGLKRSIRENPAISPLVRELVEGQPLELLALQRRLLPGERLVEYFGAGESVAAFVIGPRSFAARRLQASRAEIERRARRFAEGSASDEPLAAWLGQELIERLGDLLREERGLQGQAEEPRRLESLILVPFGDLDRVPFEALRVEGRYLVEHSGVAYLPAASMLRYLEKGGVAQERPRRLLALVDPSTDYDGTGKPRLPPLLGARAEAAAIAPLFAAPEVLYGPQASKEAWARLAPGREVIHLACHGEFFPARPLDSRLYLSRADPQDGLLRASEIYGVDLRGSRLVALSGCETGRSEVGAGEDPVGIAMAFLHSGAGALLVSLWKVEDRATSELMKTFYSRWIEGKRSRSAALREAKIALLKGGHGSPREWAPFILMGPR